MYRKGLSKFHELVEAFETLPTIGKKSAQRLAYHIVVNDTYAGIKIAHAIENAIGSIKKCSKCGNMSENEICEICMDEDRNGKFICIVQSSKDIFTIEESKQFYGRYFVITELDETVISNLINFIKENNTEEILFAITPGLANDAFILYIEEQLQELDLKFSKIAQGVPTGVSLENVDILSLAKAIESKTSI